MSIVIDAEILMDEFKRSDLDDLVHWFDDPEIYQRTLRIPHPYTREHGQDWIEKEIARQSQTASPTNFAIRKTDRKLIGGFAFSNPKIENPFRSEIGYWLAKPFWGQGIMSKVVARMSDHAFSELKYDKLIASVFEWNVGSYRVLEKNGFKLEGRLPRHFYKDGKYIDARLYGRTQDDLSLIHI